MADQDVRHYPHPVIAREGWAFVGLSLFLALAATIVGLESVALLLWIIATTTRTTAAALMAGAL